MATIPIARKLSATESGFSIATLTRSDTGLAPAGVSLPIALANTSGTIWTGSFVDASPAPLYNAIGLITFLNGGTANTPPFQIVGIGVAGAWGTFSQACAIYSTDNENLWSTQRSDGTPSASQQQGAFDQATAEITMAILLKGLGLPSAGTPAFTALGWIEAELAGVNLYSANGLQDAAKGMDGKLTLHRQRAMRRLRNLIRWSQISPGTAAALPLGTGQTSAVPQSIAPCTDDFGRLVATSTNPNPYGLATFYPWWGAGF